MSLMSSSNITTTTIVKSKGIYHGLPVYPATVSGLRALVVGANGISGQAMVEALAENPARWSSIFAMSRKGSVTPSDSMVTQLLVDLLDGPEAVAKVLEANNVQV